MAKSRRFSMPLRCAYKAFCIVCADDGLLCATGDGDIDVYDTARNARKQMVKYTGSLKLKVARCYVVPAEMWEEMQ